MLLLLVLKAFVFGAGYLGNHGYKGRELEEGLLWWIIIGIVSIFKSKLTTLLSENVVSQSEVTLALGYLMGDTCLYRAACEEPHVAKEYLRAAEIIIETMKLLPQYVVWSNIVSLN